MKDGFRSSGYKPTVNQPTTTSRSWYPEGAQAGTQMEPNVHDAGRGGPPGGVCLRLSAP